MCDQQSLRSVCAYAQSDQSLCWSLEYSMIVKLMTEHRLEFLSLKGGCRGSSVSTHVKMPDCQTSALRRITRGSHIAYYSLMFLIAITFKGQVHVFSGRVKIVSHSSCRTSAIFKYFCPLAQISYLSLIFPHSSSFLSSLSL